MHLGTENMSEDEQFIPPHLSVPVPCFLCCQGAVRGRALALKRQLPGRYVVVNIVLVVRLDLVVSVR